MAAVIKKPSAHSLNARHSKSLRFGSTLCFGVTDSGGLEAGGVSAVEDSASTSSLVGFSIDATTNGILLFWKMGGIRTD
jgi:hypothetical protein